MIWVVEIVVVVGKAKRETLDDERWEFGGFAAPLFFGVAFDEFFVDVGAYEFEGLFLKVFRLYFGVFLALFFYFDFRFAWIGYPPKLAESVHVERQIE